MCACLHEDKDKNKKTNVSVQTSTIVTQNPLAISMVTIKPTVQRLCEAIKRQAKTQRGRYWPCEWQQALYWYEMTQNWKRSGWARMMCSAINSESVLFFFFFFFDFEALYITFLFLLFTVVKVCRLLTYYNLTLQKRMCRLTLESGSLLFQL